MASLAVSISVGYKVRVAAGTIIALAGMVAVISKLAMYNQHLYLIASICLILPANQRQSL